MMDRRPRWWSSLGVFRGLNYFPIGRDDDDEFYYRTLEHHLKVKGWRKSESSRIRGLSRKEVKVSAINDK